MLGGPVPDRGEDPIRVIDTIAEAGRGGTVASQSPRYFGFVIGGSIPAAIVTDWLVSTWDQNAQTFVMSPISAVIEEIVSDWPKGLFGLPKPWSVGFVTGAQMASFTSLRMLGLGAERARRVETDTQGRMRPDRLGEMLRGGTGPCIVCTQIGNVNTGAADPIEEIASLTRERGAWRPIDAAFALWAATSQSRRHLVTGIERADSIATDRSSPPSRSFRCDR